MAPRLHKSQVVAGTRNEQLDARGEARMKLRRGSSSPWTARHLRRSAHRHGHGEGGGGQGPPAFILLRAAEAHTLPGADPTEAQVEIVREAENYLAGIGDAPPKDRERSAWRPACGTALPSSAIVEAALGSQEGGPHRDEHARAERPWAPHPRQRGRVRAPGHDHADPAPPRAEARRVATPGGVGQARPTKEAARV